MKTELLRVEFLCKFFHQDMILDHISFNIFEGETLVLLGVNGAGKTPLVKVLGGILQKDSGDIFFYGEKLAAHSLEQAQCFGIHIVQHCGRVVDELSVSENICLPARPHGWINRKKNFERAKELMALTGLERSPSEPTRNLCASEKSLLELAAVLNRNPKLLIFDEPPLPYSASVKQKFLDIILHLKKKRSSVIYVTDNIKNALEVADRILVLRDGIVAGVFDRKDPCFDQHQLLMIMAGKDKTAPSVRSKKHDDILMEAHDLSCRSLKNISLKLYRNEILGVVGPVDSNKSVFLRMLYGVRDSGTILLDGVRTEIHSPADAIRCGIAYFTSVAADSHLVSNLSVLENITFAATRRVGNRFGWIKPHIEKHYALSLLEAFSIPAACLDFPVGELSSGLRQKIQFIQCLAVKPRIMLLYEPTNGVDLETKRDILAGIKRLAENGCTFVLVSSNLQESFELCDRFLILNNGAIRGEISKDEAEQSTIIELMQK